MSSEARVQGRSRRDALRALAAGSVGAVAGSAIVSTSAFADSGSVPCRVSVAATTLTLTTTRVRVPFTNEYSPRIAASLSAAPAQCPCRPSTAPTVEIKWDLAFTYITSPPAGTTVHLARSNAAVTAGVYGPIATTGFVHVASLPDDVAPAYDDLEINANVTVTATVRFTCPGRSATNAVVCIRRAVSFGWNGPSVTPDNFTSGPTVGTQVNNVAC